MATATDVELAKCRVRACHERWFFSHPTGTLGELKEWINQTSEDCRQLIEEQGDIRIVDCELMPETVDDITADLTRDDVREGLSLVEEEILPGCQREIDLVIEELGPNFRVARLRKTVPRMSKSMPKKSAKGNGRKAKKKAAKKKRSAK